MRLTTVALALLGAVAPLACGEKEERVPAASGAEVRSLLAAGVRAVGAEDSVPRLITFNGYGPELRVRTAPLPGAKGLLHALPLFRAVSAEIVPFCPKPAILRCRPALRASGVLRDRRLFPRVVDELQSLARRTYEQRPLRRRRRAGQVDIVTANGELLAAARLRGSTVCLSFGGPDPPARAATTPDGRLTVAAGREALAAAGLSLRGPALGTLAGVRRAELSATLTR